MRAAKVKKFINFNAYRRICYLLLYFKNISVLNDVHKLKLVFFKLSWVFKKYFINPPPVMFTSEVQQ